MDVTTLSSRYQLVIPRRVREAMQLEPGQRFSVVARGHVVELVPLGDVRDLRGVLAGADTSEVRDQSDVDGPSDR